MEPSMSNGPFEPRAHAAPAAGPSVQQRKTAVRIGAASEAEFEQQVESDDPPMVTQLADQGRTPAPSTVDYETPEECQAVLEFGKFCSTHEPIGLARRCNPGDVAMLRQWVAAVDRWLDRFVSNLEE
jgi:hypothetical protein